MTHVYESVIMGCLFSLNKLFFYEGFPVEVVYGFGKWGRVCIKYKCINECWLSCTLKHPGIHLQYIVCKRNKTREIDFFGVCV